MWIKPLCRWCCTDKRPYLFYTVSFQTWHKQRTHSITMAVFCFNLIRFCLSKCQVLFCLKNISLNHVPSRLCLSSKSHSRGSHPTLFRWKVEEEKKKARTHAHASARTHIRKHTIQWQKPSSHLCHIKWCFVFSCVQLRCVCVCTRVCLSAGLRSMLFGLLLY